ncbi:hypothetical protein B0H13DRAFT_2376582 [Mycena leptocephala]|nr:hypothetical protein B0H13DRAFT_2376582 [Mycena leptocephala]
MQMRLRSNRRRPPHLTMTFLARNTVSLPPWLAVLHFVASTMARRPAASSSLRLPGACIPLALDTRHLRMLKGLAVCGWAIRIRYTPLLYRCIALPPHPFRLSLLHSTASAATNARHGTPRRPSSLPLSLSPRLPSFVFGVAPAALGPTWMRCIFCAAESSLAVQSTPAAPTSFGRDQGRSAPAPTPLGVAVCICA